MADETEQKSVDTQTEKTEPSTAKKTAAKKSTPRKPAANKSASTPDDLGAAAETAKKTAAKKPAAKKEATSADAPGTETAKKPAVKKPAAKKSATPTDESTAIDKKTVAKKAVASKPAPQKAESAPKPAAPRKAAPQKKTEAAKPADLPMPRAEIAQETPVSEAAAPRAAAKPSPIKNYEAPEGRKSARGRVAKKVDDTQVTAAAPESAATETINERTAKTVSKSDEKKKSSPKPIAKSSEEKAPEVPRIEIDATTVATIAEPAIPPSSQPTHPLPPEAQPESGQPETKVEDKKVENKKVEEKKESTPQELLDRGAEWLKELFVRMNLKAKVETREQDTDLLFNVSVAQDSPASENLSARALESIQTLLADVLSERGIGRIVVDIDGFLQNRDTELSTIASKLAKTARKVNGAITIAGFNAHERRVIHQSLEVEKDLKTESTDIGAFRKLRIFNKK